MALPKIRPYTYTVTDHPNKVNWSLDPSRAALLVHDMQYHFVDVFDREDDSAQINVAIRHIAGMLRHARENNVPVYFTAQPPRQAAADRQLLTDFWGPGLAEDSAAQIIAEVAPEDGDIVLDKWRYSAFAKSNFEQELKDAGRDQLVICGVYAHIGCLTTATDAFMRDIQPFLVADSLADFTADEHTMACDYAAQRCARVVDSDYIDRAFAMDEARRAA